ncbi:MAG: tyrosine-type recombinase/integrase, partial [Pseudomonadota bacterium]
ARAGIKPLTPHSCRHGFATDLLRAGVDVKTVAKMGGWKDATTVLRTFAHAQEERNITEVLFSTILTKPSQRSTVTN